MLTARVRSLQPTAVTTVVAGLGERLHKRYSDEQTQGDRRDAGIRGILVVSAGLLAQQTNGGGAGQRGAEPDQPAIKGLAPLDPAVKALIEARLTTAREVFEQEIARIEQTLPPFSDDTSVWSRRWMEEQLRLSPKPADKLAAIQAHLERAKRIEKSTEQYAKTGQFRTADALKAKYFSLEAEQMLAEARATQPNVR